LATLDKIYQNSQAYKPYTQFGNVNLWSNFAHSTYHSSTIRVEKRFSHGLDLNAFWTWRRPLMKRTTTVQPVALPISTGGWRKRSRDSISETDT